ncbi:30S ribosomal protein THX [Dyadobacter psychrotolerans]|uniref:30S ribosomal protein THX n=1 Tax=Dyadobacter psychrotolerans TaxID=2541721 RepID=A0A4R5DL12_9BACT|nr:30S ribosomal protein THX [Dyadobacter psychrotolerans]TDE12720.1 30S ribosomal protein THX [Dyadobacter psychrotolerans]
MRKGDRKTKRGKIWFGTFGKLRRPLENEKRPESDVPDKPAKSY